MPARPTRRALRVRTSSLQLVLSIALGLWLGFVLMLLTGWLAWRYWYAAAMPMAPVPPLPPLGGPPAASAPQASLPRANPPAPPPVRNPGDAPPPALPPAAPASGADPMFEQYTQSLHKQELRQAEGAARANPANQANPQCQFWLQQAQTTASDQSREQVARFCN